MSVIIERRGFSLPLGVGPEVEVFAMGDIHGRSDLLAALIDEAAREPKLRDKRAIVFLGDLIDRGPDSLGAIGLAMAAKGRIGADESIALMGNHETMMRLSLDPGTPWSDAIDAFETWMANGGDRTVAEFLNTKEPKDPAQSLSQARASLPPRVLAWLSSLKPSWRCGQVLFVHAGVNPQVELETFLAVPWNTPLDQLDEDRHWAWVRWPFLEHRPMEGFGGFFVVHGHTPNDARRDPSHSDQIARFRLNLDAGSAMSGVAKMAVLRDSQAEVISASGQASHKFERTGKQ